MWTGRDKAFLPEGQKEARRKSDDRSERALPRKEKEEEAGASRAMYLVGKKECDFFWAMPGILQRMRR